MEKYDIDDEYAKGVSHYSIIMDGWVDEEDEEEDEEEEEDDEEDDEEDEDDDKYNKCKRMVLHMVKCFVV